MPSFRDPMLLLDFAQVHQRASVHDLVAPIRLGFAATAATAPKRIHYELDGNGGTLLLMPAWRAGRSIGVKILTVVPKNTKIGLDSIFGSYLLLCAHTGRPRAMIDGRALTLLRTAAVSALAADHLAPRNPEVFLMVGTGALARYLIEGHLGVRRYRRVLIWGRDPVKAAAIVRQMTPLEGHFEVAEDLGNAVREADVISCATSSTEALLNGNRLKAQCHIDLVGSFRPEMREADEECFRHAHITVDTLDALSESGDLIRPLQSGIADRESIRTLTQVIAGKAALQLMGRTIFKAVGVAIADLAAAEHLVDGAR